MFQQPQGESLSEAWTRFKDLLQKVPHLGIDLWLKVQIFYDHVNPATRRTIDQSAGEILSTSDCRLIELENQVQRLMEAHLSPKQPIQVNKITSSCEICSGPHDTQYCMENLEQAFVDYASSCTDEAGGNPMDQMNFASTNYLTKEELRGKGIKSPSKLLSLKYMSLNHPWQNKIETPHPQNVFISSIIILNKEDEAKESAKSSATEYKSFILLRMIEVIKREFEKIKDVKVEDVPLICDASLEVFNDEVRYDPSDVAFIEWLRSKFFNYKTMDHYTMKALWIYWIRGDDEVELTDEESSDNDDEIAEVFRIDTNIFDYETPICSAFNEFNYLLKLTNCGKPTPLLGVRWYEALRDLNKSIEALRNKAIMEGSIKEDDESRYEQKRQWNTYTNYDDAYEINHEHNKSEELCEIQEQPVCNIKRYMMIKYSFNDDEEYVAVKEDEYDDLTVTRKEACRAYQEIFQIMDEGWMVTRAGKKVEAEKKSNLKTSL
ncbi:hypothetical protein Tco_0290723 [Tanacetum coccineum]